MAFENTRPLSDSRMPEELNVKKISSSFDATSARFDFSGLKMENFVNDKTVVACELVDCSFYLAVGQINIIT
ncbi:hypothetical protein T11_5762 [Trichinella zimbabwensis]|uniref:Uncharacterized protein n=1 Tax=Trichinella zimbabwensis TaxID=268475 RepID=A0A0V1HWF0_9BILA|nr:hypothetical protein T11_5762 [Trichinella zimbabwensis]